MAAADRSGRRLPSFIVDGYVLMVGSGNGVEHADINKAGDFSATPTGPADNVVTGHLTQWFGVSDNKQNGEFGFTFAFNGVDQSGFRLTLHDDSHANWTRWSMT